MANACEHKTILEDYKQLALPSLILPPKQSDTTVLRFLQDQGIAKQIYRGVDLHRCSGNEVYKIAGEKAKGLHQIYMYNYMHLCFQGTLFSPMFSLRILS